MQFLIKNDAKGLIDRLKLVTKNLPRAMGTATWETSKKTKRRIAQAVTETLNVPQKAVMKVLTNTRKGQSGARVMFTKSPRIPIRTGNFGTKQTATGVEYKIEKRKSKTGNVRAFMGPSHKTQNVRWAGRAFFRTSQARGPLKQMRGPSPWGYLVRSGKIPAIVEETKTELTKQIIRQIDKAAFIKPQKKKK